MSYIDHGEMQQKSLPEWVPTGALHYIEHTEKGAPIRALARAAGCHASTIMRQIRKVEMRRDDPLVDAALRKLGALSAEIAAFKQAAQKQEPTTMSKIDIMPTDAILARESMRVLRRLCETGAVLAVAEGLEKAVVVRDGPDGSNARTAVVDAPVAQAMALKDWITASQTGRITRYKITGAGRAALGELLQKFGMGSEPGSNPGNGQIDAASGAAFDDMDRNRLVAHDLGLRLEKAR